MKKYHQIRRILDSLTAHSVYDTARHLAALKLTQEAEYSSLASQVPFAYISAATPSFASTQQHARSVAGILLLRCCVAFCLMMHYWLMFQVVAKALEARDRCLPCVQLMVHLLAELSTSQPAIASHFE